MCLLFVFTTLFLASNLSLAKSKTLFYGIANETNSPFVEIEMRESRLEISGGILKRLAEALSKELEIKPTLVLLPQRRVGLDLETGDLSMVCFVHETWFPKDFEKKLLWSDPITTNINLIATIKGKPILKVEDLFGKQVGTITNYYYEKLDTYFEKGKIRRESGPTTLSNIQKLLHGRIDYMLISNLEFEYYKKKYPQLKSYNLGMDIVEVKCALSKRSGIELTQINKAINTLKKNGTLDKIFSP